MNRRNVCRSGSPHRALSGSVALLVVLYAGSSGCAFAQQAGVAGASGVSTKTPQASTAPERHAYFGDLHLHTSFSFDSAVMSGNDQVTPEVAYRFAKGEPVRVFGRTLRRRWPLDFLAVTDHPENLGLAAALRDQKSRWAGTPFARQVAAASDAQARLEATIEAYRTEHDREQFETAWAEEIAAANRNYAPGEFTTFIAYEWASQRFAGHAVADAIHRNVIFSGASAPLPFTTFDSKQPEDLWTYMESIRSSGNDVLAIVNHPTGSQGLAFAWRSSDGKQIDRAFAERRIRNEPLTEMVSGGSDHDSRPGASPDDPWVKFRNHSRGQDAGHGGNVRDGWGRGLIAQQRLAINPFGFGVVGSSDNHLGLTLESSSVLAGHENGRKNPGLVGAPNSFDARDGGLTGVWAEANTREAIFAALRRKETFATSGPRIKVRMFGGWSASAHTHGTAMGGTLPARPKEVRAPRFVLWTQAAPEGPPLERIQLVKLSLSGANYVETIINLAVLKPSEQSKPIELAWQDSEFDPRVPALYFMRVLQVPTPQKSSLFDVHVRMRIRSDWPSTTQERAWSSPIWYVP